jgi:hypothetical protein
MLPTPTVNSLNKSRLRNPTTSRGKIVASKEEKSRSLRAMLLTSLRSLKKEVRLPATVTGDLSSWILCLHGIGTDRADQEPNPSAPVLPTEESLTKWMAQIASPKTERSGTKAAIAELQKANEFPTRQDLALLYRDNRQEFDSQFKRQASKVKDVADIPDGLPALANFESFEDSLKLLRATRALAMCLSVHEAHPLSLIARATRGDRRAALDLIKIDKLFLHDSCTQHLIKKAELQNDHAFMKQLARAQTYETRLSVREMQRLYFYQLFLMEQRGISLPTQHELWRVLDPQGRQYRSLSAFEKDFQRRRKAFEWMLNDIDTKTKEVKL